MSKDREDLGRRIHDAVEKAGGIPRVSRLSGVNDSTLTRYTKGINEPSVFKLGSLARACGVSMESLVFGDQSDLTDQTSPLSADLQNAVMIPLLDVVASAGAGAQNEPPRILEMLPFPRTLLDQIGVRPGDAHFIKAKGDSMETTIRDGALVLVDSSKKRVTRDGIYVLILDGDARIKRVARGFDSYRLISDNPAYPEDVVPRAVAAEQLQIAGEVVWAGGQL